MFNRMKYDSRRCADRFSKKIKKIGVNLCNWWRIIFFLFPFSSRAQSEYVLIKKIPFAMATFFTTDALGNAYVIGENQLLQFDARGNPVNNYSATNTGSLQFVDAL